MSIKAHMICHTHWDREWYLTREEFRTKLVRLIDELLDLIDEVPDYVSFMLDGQTIAIEDYLEIKPYKKEKLFAALRQGKIICGPWYILPDELLISGEAHIRNYMRGTQVIEEAGKKMEIAYLPDSFGHPAQMPQIIEGLGMKAMVFWRGVSNDVKKTEFYWESPFSDSKILCIHMPHGYGNSGNLSSDMKITVPRMTELLESLKAKSTTDVVLLMNGSDHIIGQKNICEVVKELNAQLQNYEIELSTLENYLTELQERLDELNCFSGEFRSGERSMLLGGTLSTRMYLKQKNDEVQNKAERYLEPMLAIEKICGFQKDNRGYMDYLWKKILENHPHDSICGCSIDEVHQEMMNRYNCVEQLEDTLIKDVVVSHEAVGKAEDRKASIFLFEPTKEQRKSYKEVEICLDQILVQEVDFTKSVIVDYEDQISHPDLPDGIRIVDELGREIPHVILEMKKDYTTLYQDHTMPEIYKVNKIKAGLLLPDFTYGCHQLFVETCDVRSKWRYTLNEREIENEFYRLVVEKDGLILTDKKRGKIYKGFSQVIDKGDAGDEYTYSWPECDKEYTLEYTDLEICVEEKEEISQTLYLKGALYLPKELQSTRKCRSKELVSCPFEMKFTLYQGIDRIDCWMKFENHAKDHRLQVQFPSGIETNMSRSYDIFHVTEHPVEVNVPEKWMEYPQSTHPTHGYVEVCDDSYGMSVGVKGLAEYEALHEQGETKVNITLLRCVGWLSRTDLLTRHGNGGWTIETEEAQCLGTYEFEFCVTYGEKEKKEAFGIIEKFRYPSYTQTLMKNGKHLLEQKNAAFFLNQLPQEVELSALKVAENQKGIVLRIYNLGEEKKNIAFDLPDSIKKTFMTNLAEQIQREIKIEKQKIKFEIHEKQIITLYMEM